MLKHIGRRIFSTKELRNIYTVVVTKKENRMFDIEFTRYVFNGFIRGPIFVAIKGESSNLSKYSIIM